MKATGIVRRIDDLGRVVIPKEIRRTFRLGEGDPVEIFVTGEGILFKKYSPIGELGDFAKEFAESLHESTNHIVLISDKDSIITVSGGSKREFFDKPIGDLVESCMESKKSYLNNETKKYQICKDSVIEYNSCVIVPIIFDGEPIGTIILLGWETAMGNMEMKMAETAASFLAKQMG